MGSESFLEDDIDKKQHTRDKVLELVFGEGKLEKGTE